MKKEPCLKKIQSDARHTRALTLVFILQYYGQYNLILSGKNA